MTKTFLEAFISLTSALGYPIGCILMIIRYPTPTQEDTTAIKYFLGETKVHSRLCVLLATVTSERDRMILLKEINFFTTDTFPAPFDSKSSLSCNARTISSSKVLMSDFIPFSKCILWTRQQAFYETKKLRAFETVPSRISCNTFVSNMYIQRVDHIAQIRSHELNKSLKDIRVCIIELGSGKADITTLLARRY